MRVSISWRVWLFAWLWCGCFAAAQTAENVLESARGKVAVLIFVRTDCPVSNRYAPTVQAISARNAADARFFLVFPDKAASTTSMEKYRSDFGYGIPAVHDPEHVLVKDAHATFTPEAAVFDRKGTLVYHGRIDNLYVTFGRARAAATTHELEDAIAAVRDGRAVARGAVEGVGCSISDLQ